MVFRFGYGCSITGSALGNFDPGATAGMTIEDFGARVASVWEGLRPATRTMLERAMHSTSAGATAPSSASRAGRTLYDAGADRELSQLLAALDERVMEESASLNSVKSDVLRKMAETTAAVLQNQTESAEVFVQLIARAQAAGDYSRIDALADVLTLRFAPSEICELVRQPNAVVRALAQEALAQAPTSLLVALLGDPVDSEIGREALIRQAADYGSDEARHIVSVLSISGISTEDV